MRKRTLTLLALVLLVLVVAPLPAIPAVPVAQAQVENTLGLTTWPSYLGPEVVLSGDVSSAAGIPTVTVTVEDVDVAGVPVFSGPATTGLRPPLGLPAASWRVPLTLADGNYQFTVVSSLEGQTLQEVTGDFAVVSAVNPPVTVIPFVAEWSYYDTGDTPAPTAEDPPVEWFELPYDASLWASGPAELGYGDGEEATLTAETGVFGEKILAQYFRHEFTPGDLAEFDTLTLSMLRDDGAVVYLNGVEIARSNMPDGPVSYGTFATAPSEQTVDIAIDPALILAGTNLLAVEVHQSSFTSSDISFAASLSASSSDAPRTSNSTEGTFVLAAGDMARCNSGGDELVADQMADLFDTDRGLFIGLGDLVYDSGTIDQFISCYDPTIGQFRDVTWPSPGNHEHYTAPNAAGYRQYFGPAAGPTAGPDGGLWYSFDIDEYWHVIALDSDCWGRETLPGAIDGDGCAVGSDQEQWLRADLEANQDKNILAFFHHPPYTNNQYTDHQLTWPLWRALAEYGAELTLHGHEHHYERYMPLDYWGDAAAENAITEFIIGSGGTFPRYDVQPPDAESAFRGTFAADTFDYGVLQLWLRPDGYEWKWESIFGLAPVDSGTAGLNEPMGRGVVAGQVTNLMTAEPLAGLDVCMTANRTQLETCTTTAADGSYAFDQPVVIDAYELVVTDSSAMVVQPAPVEFDLVGGANTIDATMVTVPSISGTLARQDTGDFIEGGLVCVQDDRPGQVPFGPTCSSTASDGTYVVDGLELNRSYEVTFAATDFTSECYDDAADPCGPDATRVDVALVDVAGIDAALDLMPSAIEGRVTNASSGLSLGAISVCANSFRLPEPRCVETAADGLFRIEGLASGNYTVSYEDPAGAFVTECYRNRPCENALVVGVTQPNVRTNINASLDPAPVALGDADCSGVLGVVDALLIAQFTVGTRDEAPCPRTDTATQIATGSADVNVDGNANIADALLVAQCATGLVNVLCP